MAITNEEVLKEILEQSLAGYWDWDILGGYEYLSPNFKKMFGYKDHEIENRPESWQKLIFQEDLPGVYEKFRRHEESKGQIPFYNEVRYHHKNGSTVWVICTGKVIEWDENGKAKRMVGCHIDITNRKHTEEKLTKARESAEESELTFRKLFEDSSDAILLIDKKGVFVECNQAALNLLKMTREEFIFQPPVNISPEFQPNGRKSEEAALEMIELAYKKGLHRFDWTCLNSKGEEFIVEVSLMPISVKGETMLHTTWRDVTKRSMAEKAIERRVAALTRPGDDGIGSIAFEELFNINDIQRLQDEFASATGVASIITHVDGRPITEPSNFCHLCSGIIRKTEKGRENCYKSDAAIGSSYPEGPIIQQCLSGGLWDAGAAISIGGKYIAKWLIGQVRDETQTEEKMRAYAREIEADEEAFIKAFHEVPSMSREQFGNIARVLFTLASQLSTLAYQNLQQARFISARKQAEENLLASEQKFRSYIENAPHGIIIVDENGNYVEVNEAAVKITGYSRDELLKKNLIELIPVDERNKAEEHFKTVITSGKANGDFSFLNKDGKSGYLNINAIKLNNKRFLGFVSDITNRIKMEEELRKNQKLESLGVLAGGIAHDFNNLLGGVFGYIDLANAEPDKSTSLQYLSKAMNAIERARALTGQLLTFAKGGDPIQKIEPLFPFVAETAKFILSGSKVSCDFDIAQDLWPCNFDRNQIGQVIDNLILNAQQAMPVGGTIQLKARNIVIAEKEHPTLKNDNYVKISVIDNGIGIQKELISRIFDPFFTTKTKGHGLGLATCYSIINRHEGSIDVESDPGKGSTFHIYLPAAKDPALLIKSRASTMHKGSGTILVMDDEEALRMMTEQMLSVFGYSVICKENGKDAVDFFVSQTKANREFAGMIFDLTVPGGMGGKEAVEEIRKLDSDIPVFVASGYAEDPVMKNPSEYGFTASICKPFRISELSEMLNNNMKVEK